MKILVVASEAAPFAKTGGLADVVGSLPRALRQLGHDVRVILPCYQAIEEQGFSLRKGRKSVEVVIDGVAHKGLLRQSTVDGVTVYFIENREFFQRSGLYGDGTGDYPDNALRFGFFCRAVLEFLRRLDFRPDVLHLNDWQSSLIPVLLRTELKNDPFYSAMGTVLTIHNLGYQGLFPRQTLAALRLDPALFDMEKMEYFGKISFLKGGIIYADRLNTVSESHCREIQTPELGFGLDGLLRKRSKDLTGILNGIDHKIWDPELDSNLPVSYSAGDLRGKASNKRALQKELGLANTGSPLVAMVTRLDSQKGLDLVEEAWDALLALDLQFVLLGTGDAKHREFFAARRDRYPGQVAIHLKFEEPLARRIYAGSDLFLMPSRYEPCGLGQMIALRYGTLPLVRRTGGLADTVIDAEENPAAANGFSFIDYSAPALLGTLARALQFYGDRRVWLRMVRRAMASDFSWARSAEHYLELYRQATEAKGV
jgi:starch synthase